MRKLSFALVAILAVVFTACSWLQKTTAPILQPLADAGCAVETSLTGGFGAQVVAECQGTDPAACGQAFQTALGNVNLCNIKIDTGANVAFVKIANAHPEWTKLGDIPASALKGPQGGTVKAMAVHSMGIIGGLACPTAINTALGLLTGVIPSQCGCKGSLSASQVGAALTAACETALSGLP